jgi:putative flippase GtrA
VVRFVFVGGANTLSTTVAFYLLAGVLPARVAFTIVYIAGLAFVIVATPRYVFGTGSSWWQRVLLALWYASVYLVGIGIISLLATGSTSRVVVVLGTVLVTAPLTFVGARLLLGRRG